MAVVFIAGVYNIIKQKNVNSTKIAFYILNGRVKSKDSNSIERAKNEKKKQYLLNL